MREKETEEGRDGGGERERERDLTSSWGSQKILTI
jgi:hypothetical protein